MAITRASGFPVIATSGTTVAVTTQTVGDMLIAACWLYTGVGLDSVSGGGATGWTEQGTSITSTAGFYLAVWTAKVTATGAQTVTFTMSGTPSFVGLVVDELAGPSALSVSATATSTGTGTALTCPSLTPAVGPAPAIAYWGWGTNENSTVSAGSTSGFAYNVTTDSCVVFDGAVVNGTAYAPTAPIALSSPWDTLGLIISAAAGASTSGFFALLTRPLRPGSNTPIPVPVPNTPPIIGDGLTINTGQIQRQDGSQFVALGAVDWMIGQDIDPTFAANQWANRTTIVARQQALGVNAVRVRLHAGYYNTLGTVNQAAYVQQFVDRVALGKAAGQIVSPCFWDPLDAGPGVNASGANFATQYANIYPLIDAICEAVNNDPSVIWIPVNEPNNITSAQWTTAFEGIISRLVTTNGYEGIIGVDPWNWANSGPFGAGYDNTVYNAIESYHAGLLGSAQQIAWSVHQYWYGPGAYDSLTQGSTGGWSLSNFKTTVLGGSTAHCFWMTEVGFDNLAPNESNLTWTNALLADIAPLPGTMRNFNGTHGFIWEWEDDNTLVSDTDHNTLTTWGNAYTNAVLSGPFSGVPTPPTIGLDGGTFATATAGYDAGTFAAAGATAFDGGSL